MNWTFYKTNMEALVFMVAFSVLGGVASYISKIKKNKALFSLTELIGEIVVSISAGMLAGLFLIDHTSIAVTLAVTSLAAHMGTRFIYSIEGIVEQTIKKRLGVEDKE